MPQPCPKACSRLATAAVFISVSVVQFIAGLILLKSKYVSLLSGPDFWTAACNLAVGILLGVSASVWKDVQKTSVKHIVRRNILASLVASAITINSTTAVILILGEGNALLSIELESDGKSSTQSEILAYSYASSVCSPIVSVVVAFVFLSGMWFRVSDKGMKTPDIKSILKKDSINDYNWVFKEKQSSPKQHSKSLRKQLSFKTLSSSSEDELFNLTDASLWSNSVHSIEYLKKSSRKGSNRIENHRHSKDRPESTRECGDNISNTLERISHETSRVSFADDRKTVKCVPHVSVRHFECDNTFSPDQIEAGDKNVSSLSYEEFKKMHSRKVSKQYRKKRMLLMEHPTFRQMKHFEGNINVQSLHKLGSPEVYIPRAHARVISESKSSSTSNIKAEVHVDAKIQDRTVDGNTSELPVVHDVGDISPCDVFTETIRNTSAKFQRTSTSKHLNKANISQSKDDDSESRKICRTSTTAGPSSSKMSHLDISDIQTDSVIDENQSYESEEEMANLSAVSPRPMTSQMHSNHEVDDSFIDAPQSNMLVGEVVKVQVNSLPRKPFHSKLVPVPIPVVSSVKENPLRRKQKDKFSLATDTFSSRNEIKFTSFHGDIKTMNEGSQHHKAGGDKLQDQKYETVMDTTVCEMSPEDGTFLSPAQTSGYNSAIFENTHLSDSESFKSKLSSCITNSPNYTPKKKLQNFRSPRNLEVEQ